MKIAILGSGEVARTLVGGFLQHGFDVCLGTRDSDKLAQWQSQRARARIAGTAAFGEVIVLAVEGTAAADSLRLAGAAQLEGKVVIDTCNPIADAPPVNGVLQFFRAAVHALVHSRLPAPRVDARVQAAEVGFRRAGLIRAFLSPLSLRGFPDRSTR